MRESADCETRLPPGDFGLSALLGPLFWLLAIKKDAAQLRRPYGQLNVRRPLSRRLEAGIQPLMDVRGSIDLPDLLEKFISPWPWL